MRKPRISDTWATTARFVCLAFALRGTGESNNGRAETRSREAACHLRRFVEGDASKRDQQGEQE